MGDRGRSRSDSGEPDDPEAGEEKTVFARLVTVGAGDTSRVVDIGGKATAGAKGLECFSLEAATDFALREVGRGRGFDRREDARSSVNVGSPFALGVEGTGRPLALPRPLRTWGEGVRGRLLDGGEVVGGAGALDSSGGDVSVHCFLW